jgi:hypothetical protein
MLIHDEKRVERGRRLLPERPPDGLNPGGIADRLSGTALAI